MEKEIIVKENERIDDLGLKNLKIIQDKEGFCFGIDAVLLSDFAKNLKKDAKVIDLGTGTGIIATLLCVFWYVFCYNAYGLCSSTRIDGMH